MVEEHERNVKWILIISLIMYFGSQFNYIFGMILTGRVYSLFEVNVWVHLTNVNLLFFILTIASSSLQMAGFWNREWMYKLSILFFIIAMALFLVQNLRWLTPL